MKSIDELQEELVQLQNELNTVPIGLLVENPDTKRHAKLEVEINFVQSQITYRKNIEVYEKCRKWMNAKKGGWASNAENHQLKAEALAFYETHKNEYKSPRAAAEHIAGTIVPLKFDAVYRHILKHNKSV